MLDSNNETSPNLAPDNPVSSADRHPETIQIFKVPGDQNQTIIASNPWRAPRRWQAASSAQPEHRQRQKELPSTLPMRMSKASNVKGTRGLTGTLHSQQQLKSKQIIFQTLLGFIIEPMEYNILSPFQVVASAGRAKPNAPPNFPKKHTMDSNFCLIHDTTGINVLTSQRFPSFDTVDTLHVQWFTNRKRNHC